MRVSMGLVFIVLFGAFTIFGEIAAAETHFFTGAYELDEGASDNMQEAFEPAIQKMGMVKRTFARRMLRRAKPDRQMRIEGSGERITLQAGDRAALTVPVNGEVVEHRTEEGDEMEVRARLDGRKLHLIIDSKQGRSTSDYILSADGERLTVVSKFDYDELPERVTLRQVFIRK